MSPKSDDEEETEDREETTCASPQNEMDEQGSDTMMQAAEGELYYYSNHFEVVLSNFRLTGSTNNKQKASEVTRSLLR